MKAGPVIIGQLLQNRWRFCIPIYQRHYVWSETKQWEPFWADIRTKAIERLDNRERRFSHFMGAVVLESRGAFSAKRVPSFQVVDGQQRLTTFQLFLAAARDYATSVGFVTTASNIESYIFNDKQHLMEESDVEKFKVWPTQFDRPLFIDILTLGRQNLRIKYPDYFYKNEDKIYNYNSLPKLITGYGFFYDRIKHAVETDDLDGEFVEASLEKNNEVPSEAKLDAVWQSLVEEFKVVEIVLEEGDDAQVIFETLNERGEPLLAADLVRNNIFQRADARRQPGEPTAEMLFAQHWTVFEDEFWEFQEKQGRFKKPRLEFFVSNFIAGQVASEVNLSKLFSEYKAFVRDRNYPTIVEELRDFGRYGACYRELIERSGTSLLAQFSRELQPWDQTTVYPLVLRLWQSTNLDASEKENFLKLLLSYIVRRAVCGLPNKNYNKSFLSIVARLDSSGWSFAELSRIVLSSKAETARFPDDMEFKRGLIDKELYSTIGARVRPILEAIECAKRTKYSDVTLPVSGLTVEHILPNSWTTYWPLPDGSNANPNHSALWFAVSEDDSVGGMISRRQRLKHTLGNFTLLTQPLNSSASNGSFNVKKEEISEHTLLELNRDILKAERWDEQRILDRGSAMAELAVGIWKYPSVPEIAS